MAALVLLKNARVASRVCAFSAMRTFSSTSIFTPTAQNPAIMMMVNTPASNIVDPMVKNSMIFESNQWLQHSPINHQLPELNQISEIECPTDAINEPLQAVKRTYQPSVLRRKRKHGFRSRRLTVSGRKTLTRRFIKGRWRMSL